jgi:hypothetical protein
MFDARSILDLLVRGGGTPPRGSEPAPGGDIFRDLLGQLAGGDQNRVPPPAHSRAPPSSPSPRGSTYQPEDDEAPSPRDARTREEADGEQETDEEDADERATESRPGAPGPQTGGQSLEDLLRSVLGGGRGPGAGSGSGGGLQDVLRDILGGGQAGPANRMFGEGAPGGGSLLDTLRQVLGQATSGVQEGAGRLDEMTGASGRARDAVGQATGQSPDELVARLKQLIASNQLGAGAALGGLGALILGTGAGRSLAGSAIKLGGLALIGGLAYKAYQNYQQGLPHSAMRAPAPRRNNRSLHRRRAAPASRPTPSCTMPRRSISAR